MRRRTLGAAAVLILALAAPASELALPTLAEDRLRDRLATLGTVTSVDVSTSPAVRLLLGDVDSAEIEMSWASFEPHSLDPEVLDRVGAVEALDLHIDELRAGPVDVASVSLNKRGHTLSATASVDADQVESLVPGAKLIVQDGSMVLELAELPLPLPLPGPIRLQVGVESGRVVARPLGTAAALLPAQTLLERPELSITRLDTVLADGRVALSADATLVL